MLDILGVSSLCRLDARVLLRFDTVQMSLKSSHCIVHLIYVQCTYKFYEKRIRFEKNETYA